MRSCEPRSHPIYHEKKDLSLHLTVDIVVLSYGYREIFMSCGRVSDNRSSRSCAKPPGTAGNTVPEAVPCAAGCRRALFGLSRDILVGGFFRLAQNRIDVRLAAGHFFDRFG